MRDLDAGDEDGDGNADCADSDCAAAPACAATPEDCATPGDEDGDDDADCADSDCATADGCFEVCDDGPGVAAALPGCGRGRAGGGSRFPMKGAAGEREEE